MPAPPVASVPQEPVVRVRIARGLLAVRVAGAGGVVVQSLNDPKIAPVTLVSPLNITRRSDRFVIESAGRAPVTSILPVLRLTAASGELLRVNGTDYPGALVLWPDAPGDAHFEAINHVPMERYLPGVIEKELYRTWHAETFRAQAIAARSYAIAECARSRGKAFDMENSQASQAYIGVGTTGVAAEAVAATRGQVLTWEGKIIPAYYSSCCGGTGQDAALALPGAPDLPPLRGTEHGSWCAGSRLYRWGPIARGTRELAARIAAWGQANHAAVGGLRGLRAIDVTARNSLGRPTRFTLTDTAGWRYPLGPEQFRFACNYQGGGAGALAESALLRSSHVSVRAAGATVEFYDGRGFGHGVGLCQHGAQALAQRGYRHEAILAFYYPGASITAAY